MTGTEVADRKSERNFPSFSLSEEKYNQLKNYLETEWEKEKQLPDSGEVRMKLELERKRGHSYLLRAAGVLGPGAISLIPKNRIALISRGVVRKLGEVLGGLGE